MAPRLVHREDEDVSAAIKDFLEKEGIHIRLNAECIHFSKSGEDSIVHVDCKEDAPEIPGSHVLLAVGRRPNTDDLGLDKAGLTTDPHGYIPIDDQLRTAVPSIWALGDCNPHGGFTHTAYNDFEIAAANILDNDPSPRQRPHPLLRPLHRPASRPHRPSPKPRFENRSANPANPLLSAHVL